MRITELLEGKDIEDLKFVRKNGDNTEIDFDLAEDLTFFMNNDDDTYRRHVYPAVTKCIDSIKHKKKTTPAIFKTAAVESYKNYLQQHAMRELPDNLDSKMCEEVCEKIHDEVVKHIADGKYKD